MSPLRTFAEHQGCSMQEQLHALHLVSLGAHGRIRRLLAILVRTSTIDRLGEDLEIQTMAEVWKDRFPLTVRKRETIRSPQYTQCGCLGRQAPCRNSLFGRSPSWGQCCRAAGGRPVHFERCYGHLAGNFESLAVKCRIEGMSNPVLVVGAGPVGLTAALLMAKNSIVRAIRGTVMHLALAVPAVQH